MFAASETTRKEASKRSKSHPCAHALFQKKMEAISDGIGKLGG